MYCSEKIFTILFPVFLSLTFVSGFAQDTPASPKPDFQELRTNDGKVYVKCFIKKVEADTLTIRHSKGIARVSFFSLDKKIQSRFNFDPIAAVRKADAEEKNRRDTKWKLFWKNQEYASAMAKKAEIEKLYKTANKTWLPVNVEILKLKDGGAYVRGSRIVFVPTQTESILGIKRAGPLKKTMVPLKPAIIFIQHPFEHIVPLKGLKWEGYIEPFSTKKVQNLSTGHISTEVHRALPRLE